MARNQTYGIKYPFTLDNEDLVYTDLNMSYEQGIASQVMHIILTPKGQRLRDPEFGTNLIRFIFEPNDTETYNGIKSEITEAVGRYMPNVSFKDIQVLQPEGEETGHGTVINIKYSVKKGNTEVLQGASITL